MAIQVVFQVCDCAHENAVSETVVGSTDYRIRAPN